jgi:predicted nucleotidyltransferase
MPIAVANKQEIAARIKAHGRELAALGVAQLGLFGSFVEGRQTRTSDVDVLVEFLPGMHTFDNFMDLAFLLEEVLGTKVELLTRESLSPHIGPHILNKVEHVTITS